MTYLRSVGVGFAVFAVIVLAGLALQALPSSVPSPDDGSNGISAPGSSPTLGLGAEWTYIDRRDVAEADRPALFPGLSWNRTVKAKRIGKDIVLERHEADLRDRVALEGFVSASGTPTSFSSSRGYWVVHPRLGSGLLFLGIREAAFLASPALLPGAPIPEELRSYIATISVP
jgi:hypothetical protein